MTAYRVELIGPSGVGKTTLVNLIRERHPDEAARGWLLPADIESDIALARAGSTAGQRLRRAVDGTIPEDFFATCFRILADSTMKPSQKFSAATILRKSCEELHEIGMLSLDRPLLHDELLLHRAFSLLPQSSDVERDAGEYFQRVPLPDAVCILRVSATEILARVLNRGTRPNCYSDLSDSALHEAILRSLRACDIARDMLTDRGVAVHEISGEGDPADWANRLLEVLDHEAERAAHRSELMARLLASSRSFRKKAGRHELRTADVAYCSFNTPAFGVPRAVAQRDAPARLARFHLTRDEVAGKHVLDLGCNAGAMLLELSGMGIHRGLGIEFDGDKVRLASEIAELSNLEVLEFRQHDIDTLNGGELGRFDLVLALAIEAHVLDADRLYRLLAEVTGGLLCFEGNGRCDIRAVGDRLLQLGFERVEYLGFCDDDVRPSNNNRPLLKAWKPSGSMPDFTH